MNRTILWLLLATLLLPVASRGQIYFNHLGKENGLPQINIMSIYQDETGAMWFGTISGLCRYNGSSTRVFRSSPKYPGLTRNSILSITGNGNGAVYIRAENDLVRYDVAGEKFGLICEGVTAIYYGGGKLWAATGDGIHTWSEHDGAMSLYSNTTGIEGRVDALCVSDGGDVWIGCQSGLVVIKAGREGERARVVADNFDIRSLYIDSEGLVWAGTGNDGIHVFDAQGNIEHHFRHTPGKNSISNDFVRTITEDERGAIWAGTFFGLNSFDKSTGEWTNYINDDTMPGSLSHSSVFSIYRNAQNTMWVGTYFGGVNYFNPRSDIFRYYDASSTLPDKLSFPFVGKMTEDAHGNLWICTEGGGLNRLDLRSRRFERYLNEGRGVGYSAGNNLKSIWHDPRTGKLYIGIHNRGLYVFDTKSRKGKLLRRPEWSTRAIQSHRGSIIALTQLGLRRIDTEADMVIPFSDDARLNEQVNREYPYSFFIDSRDRLWISTSSDLLKRIDLNTRDEKYYLHDGADPRSFGRFSVTSFVETRRGELFFGTLGSGLFRYNPATDDFDSYTEENKKQFSDFSYHISEMSNGNLLILHDNAMSIFDPQKEVMSYRSSDKFPLSGFFEGSSSYITSGGEIFVGGVDGLVSFEESSLIETPPMDYRLFFDRLTVNGEVVRPDDGTGILSKTLPLTDKIVLRHDRNNFSIEFTTSDYLEYGTPPDCEYRLEGLENEWTPAPTGTVTYTNLDPGRYTLRVREANPDKSDELKNTRSLAITVSPPLYMTAFAQVIYVLLSTALVAGIIFFFVWRYRMRTSLEMERKEKENVEQLNRMKLAFFTSVSHEFRTPLTLILAQIEHLVSSHGLVAEVKQGIAKVYDNANHLRDLMSELLDFRKVEQGFYRLKPDRVDLSEYIGDICRSFADYADNHRIKYEYDYPQGAPVETFVDKTQLKKAIYNLLSNAFKYTSDGGEITVRLRVCEEHIHIEVEDNGIGIPSEVLSKIFERFYQVEYRTSGFSLGTGIGLALTKEIIESHRGEIAVYSTPDHGSLFVISLPRKGIAAGLPPACDRAMETSQMAWRTSAMANETGTFVKTGSVIADVIAAPVDESVPVSAPLPESGRDSILIVEDNDELLTLLAGIFAAEYIVHTAQNGRQGLEMAREHLPDVILTDVIMPEMSGKEMCAAIKNDMRLSHIPVVMLTALDSIDETVEGYMFGADDYVAKPFNVEILKARCAAVVRGRRMLYRTAGESRYASAVEIHTEQERLFIEKATAIIRENFDNSEFDMNKLAAEMGMGRNKLYMSMKKISNMTPNEFTLATKLRESTDLLSNHLHLNVSEIADRLGFSSTKYFSRCFKAFYGVSPAQWRKESTVKEH